MEENNNLDLRSEKIRKIIGRIPPRLVRTGTVVITLLVIGMMWAATTIHIPMTIEGNGYFHRFNIEDTVYSYVNIEIPYKYMFMFYNQKRTFKIAFDGLPENEYTVVTSYEMDYDVKEHDGGQFFLVLVRLDNAWANKHRLKQNQVAHASTLISDKTLWKLIFHDDDMPR